MHDGVAQPAEQRALNAPAEGSTPSPVASEVWRPVPLFEGLYSVSNLGRVFSLPRLVVYSNGSVHPVRGREVPREWRKGYPRVVLWRARQRTRFRLNRLVLLTFIGPPPEPDMVAAHHPDPNTDNCAVENLVWASPRANRAECHLRHGWTLGDWALEALQEMPW